MTDEDLSLSAESETPGTPPPSEEVAHDSEPSLQDELSAAFDRANSEDSDEQSEEKGQQPTLSEAKEQEPEPEKPATPAIDAPHSWPAEMKSKFGDLPSDVQQYIAQREQETHGQISKLGQIVSEFKPVASILESNLDVLEANGATANQALTAFFNVQRGLDSNPSETLQRLAHAYGVDLWEMAAGADENPQPQQPSLEVQNLQRHVQQLTDKLTAFEQAAQAQAEQEQASRAQQMESIVDAFVTNNADANAVEAEIVAIIPSIVQQHPNASPQDVLAKAYEAARWSNPTTRQRLLQEQAANADRTRKAKSAGQINVNGAVAANEALSLDDALSQAFDRAYAN